MIAFYGGSFDPIHLGHLHVATTLSQRYSFSRFFFVPAFQNPLKGKALADNLSRLQMLEASLKELGNPKFEILDWEIKKSEKSYTIETVERLRSTTNEEIALIMGNEVFSELKAWKNPSALLQSAHVIVEERIGKTDVPEVLRQVGIKNFLDAGRQRFSHSNGTRWIEVQNVSPPPFTATAIREEISEMWRTSHTSNPPHGIQRSVWQVVKENRLYAVS